MQINVFNLVYYFLGSSLGVFLAIYFTCFGDLEELSLNWPFINFFTDEWTLLFMLLTFSFTVYCLLKLHYEIKKFNKPTLTWWQKGIIYQVYPKSFKDTNGDGVGDLKGVAERVDYFKAIGANIIYLNPIYPSGGKDNGYDVTSFTEIDRVFGTMNDFEALVEKLHKNDMYVVIDFIPNHTSDQHEWFKKSCESDKPDNPYRDYYIWYPSNDKKNPPNNWVPIVGTSAWTYHEKRKAWYYHTFLADQPDLNMRNPKVQEEMKKVLKFWLHSKNVDGIRIDAAKHLFEDASLRDEPKVKDADTSDPTHIFGTLDHIYTVNQPETYKIITEWRAYIDEIGKIQNRQKLLYVESYGSPEEQSRYFNYKGRTGAHFPLNFQLVGLRENKTSALTTVKECHNFTPENIKSLINAWNKCSKTKNFWSNWQLGNHDLARVATRIGSENVNLANALNLLIGGTPLTYYGEELGMHDLDYNSISFEDCQDNFGKTFGPQHFKKYNRDYCRSPMQWDNSQNAGFTKPNGKPWLPIHPNFTTVNVKQQLENSRSPLKIFSELAKIRQMPSFQWGSFRYAIVDEHVFSFIRSAFDNPSFLVAMNLSDEDVTINFQATRLMPSKVSVVYYFDNNEKSSNSKYEINKDVLTKSVVLSAKSCLITTWFSE